MTKPQRILVLSDIHGNLPALENVLKHAAGRYDTIWFLGDAVGYYPFPIECLDLLRQHVAQRRWRTGNHDIGLFHRAPEFNWAGPASTTLAIHRRVLQEKRPDLWKWLHRFATLERCGPLVRSYGRSRQVWTHANLDNNLGDYLFPYHTFTTRSHLLNLHGYLPRSPRPGLLLAGHSHVPCLFHLPADETTDFMRARPVTILWGKETPIGDGYYYLNPGSVGQPRDGNPKACYLLLDTHKRSATWHRVCYDINFTIQEIRIQNRRFNYGYPEEWLSSMLETGGTAEIIEKLSNVYRIEPEGLIAIQVP